MDQFELLDVWNFARTVFGQGREEGFEAGRKHGEVIGYDRCMLDQAIEEQNEE